MMPCSQFQFGHGFGQRGDFPLADLRVGHGLANLNEHTGPVLLLGDEINLLTRLGLVVKISGVTQRSAVTIPEKPKPLYQAYPAVLIEMYPVSPLANNARNDSPA